MDSVPPAEPERLKLRAIDNEDLAVLAAFLQDAIADVSEMAYLPEDHRFAMIVCRFRWERAVKAEPVETFERVTCAVTIEDAAIPQYRGFSLADRDRMMPLLTTIYDDGAVHLTFGGGAAIRIPVEKLDLRMEDFGSCWPTTQKPEHGNETQ